MVPLMDAMVSQQKHGLRRPWRQMTVLLLDISASMNLGTPRRIDVLWQAVMSLRTPETTWRTAVFSHRCVWVDVQEVPDPYGNTNLAAAFAEVGKVQPLRIFARNLVMETVADEFGDLFTHNEAESVVQHYKILPWTLMIDLTLDGYVAKAFAALMEE